MNDVENDILKLQPALQISALQFLELAKERGLKVFIYETIRTQERQKYLLKQGFSKVSKSMHMFGAAFDVVFDGKKPWDKSHDWTALGQVGKDLGLYWGGDWKNFVDKPHFQGVPATVEAQNKIYDGWHVAIPFATLIKKSIGKQVELLQILIQKQNRKIIIDGLFGSGTETIVKDLQKRFGLTADGIVRNGLWQKLI